MNREEKHFIYVSFAYYILTASFGVLLMADCVKLACCKCRNLNVVYVCASIPQSKLFFGGGGSTLSSKVYHLLYVISSLFSLAYTVHSKKSYI